MGLTLCLCGCGREILKEGNKYIHGHNNRGLTFSKEHKDKIKGNNAKYWSGRQFTEGHKKKLRLSMLGNKRVSEHLEFKSYGWETLFFDETQVNENYIKEKI